jgi:hypothetical protein
MVKITHLVSTKAFLIILAILIICGIIAFIALFRINSVKAPAKAVYVFQNLKF